MQRDLRQTPRFEDISSRFHEWLQVGSGEPAGFADVALSPDGRRIAGVSVLADRLEGIPPTRICIADVETGRIEVVSSGPNSERAPVWSPDGATLAYVSDRDRPHDFHVRIHDIGTKADRKIAIPDHFVEYVLWSPDGASLLIGAAGVGADLAGAQGGIASPLAVEAAADWAPVLEAGADESHWRSLWLADVAGGTVRRISPAGCNIWEAAWCGADKVVVCASDAPGEEVWYTADARLLDVAAGTMRTVYRPKDQIGWLSASPDGRRIALVEAVCSDRTIVAGDLIVVEVDGGGAQPIDTGGVDVTFTDWQSDTQILYAGHRSFETELGLASLETGAARALWNSDVWTFGDARFPRFSKGRAPGDCAFVKEGFFHAPQLVLFESGEERTVAQLGAKTVVARVAALGSAEPFRWLAPDGLEIHGWLIKPEGPGPHPLIVHIHGGPVWLWRQTYLGRICAFQALVEAGYAVFYPNPRGSSGRGQDYARQVFGDMGGKDTQDYLSGVDALVKVGVADPDRIGVTGGSYGGFMSSWLITQDPRFAAAVPLAPVTDWCSEHLTCHIPHFCEMFLADTMTNPGGKYFSRSPIFFAQRVRTPTLSICGALDRNTPPGQAMEFHRALRLNGVESVLATYPMEGHGVRNFPAVFDYGARLIDWFERFMPATPGGASPTATRLP